MRIGLIARSDNGGIAAQSLAFAEHLPIEVTLVVDLQDKGRGPLHSYDWPNPIHVAGPQINDFQAVNWFLDQCDVILTVETFYNGLIIDLARRRGIPRVRYANPELYKPEGETHIVLPTTWEIERFEKYPNVTMIRQGIDIPDNIDEMKRDRNAQVLLHMTAPAMLDRNGTIQFFGALNKCRQSFVAKIVGPNRLKYHESGKQQYIYETKYVKDRFAWYSDDIDLLVLPRRYAGLSLPMLEAASRGIPTITTDLSPQNTWFGPDALVKADTGIPMPMVGGQFRVHTVDVDALARKLDHLAKQSIAPLSQMAIEWAKYHSWELVAPEWMTYLENL